jgi:H+/Cl- antiporter ClcA
VLQYASILDLTVFAIPQTPATIASIVAVLTKSVVTGSDVMGYFQYPFLDTTLPSEILTNAILYGILGTGFGVVYVRAVKGLKNLVHTAFSHDSPHQEAFILPSHELQREETSFKDTMEKSVCSRLPPLGSAFHAGIEPVRAALEGTVAGFMVGVIGIFFPHVLFWGEAQLQSLIDKGKTPLPVFGHGDDTTADFLSLAQCLSTEDGGSAEGFTLACSLSLAFFKIVVTGLSLGTGIIGGHFWGPLFAGMMYS